jgi:hypothetical protein
MMRRKTIELLKKKPRMCLLVRTRREKDEEGKVV